MKQAIVLFIAVILLTAFHFPAAAFPPADLIQILSVPSQFEIIVEEIGSDAQSATIRIERNGGNAAGKHSLNVLLDGQLIDAAEVTLPFDYQLMLQGLAVGNHAAEVVLVDAQGAVGRKSISVTKE